MTRNLWAAEMSLRELGTVSLDDARGYLDLLAEQKPEMLERAAVRWHGRLAIESELLTLSEAQLALSLLSRVFATASETRSRSCVTYCHERDRRSFRAWSNGFQGTYAWPSDAF